MAEKKPVSFKEAHKDKWGNQHVLCPVCELPFAADGVLHHIVNYSKRDRVHAIWLRGYAHGWQDACSRVEASLGKIETLLPTIPVDVHTPTH